MSTQSDLESNLGKIPSRLARPRRTDRRLGAGEADWAHGRVGQQTHRMLDWCLAGRIASPLVECACSHRAIMRTTAGPNFAPSDCRIQAAYGIALCSRERIPSRMRASVFDENEPCVNHVRVSAYLLSINLSAKVTHLTVCGSVAWVRFEHGFEFRQHELPPSFAALRQSSPCIRLTSRNTKGTPPSQPCSQRNDVCNVACKCSRRYYYNILNGYPSPPTRLQSNCLQSAFGGVSSSLRIPPRVPAHLIPMCHWPPSRLWESSRHPRWREAS